MCPVLCLPNFAVFSRRLAFPLLLGVMVHCGSSSSSLPTLPPGNFLYSNPQIQAVTGNVITPDVPYGSMLVGQVQPPPTGTYTITPALPDGLFLDSGTGVITGMPQSPFPLTSYGVTVTNSGGSSSTLLSIAIYAQGAPYDLFYGAVSGVAGYPATPDVPTLNGTTTATFSISPALPGGLVLDPATGTLSGTPTAESTLTTYQVTASNADGSTTASLQIQIGTPSAPAIAYPAGSMALNVGTAMASATPTLSTLPPAQSFSVLPELPTGLSLDPQTGVLTGTPSAVSPMITYRVTATNAVGSAQTPIVLSVNPPGWALISSFAASPTTVVFGQDLTLSWNVDNGSDAIYINGLAIDVADNGDILQEAPPPGSTTYTLAATNSVGTSQAQVTVTATGP